MYETFENLPPSKREHILQVCIEEFAVHGYENSSTNTITKKLGISKGALFLYFKNKKNLYLYLMDYVLDGFIEDYLQHFSQEEVKETDFFDLFEQLLQYFRNYIQINANAFRFMLKAFLDTPAELREEIETRHDNAHDRIFKTLNTDNFRRDIDPDTVLDIILIVSHHILDRMFKDYQSESDDFIKYIDEYFGKLKEHLKIIKYGAYRLPAGGV